MQEGKDPKDRGNYDLSEEGSLRPGDEKATEIARKLENDDIGGGDYRGDETEPYTKDSRENRVWTSSSED